MPAGQKYPEVHVTAVPLVTACLAISSPNRWQVDVHVLPSAVFAGHVPTQANVFDGCDALIVVMDSRRVSDG